MRKAKYVEEKFKKNFDKLERFFDLLLEFQIERYQGINSLLKEKIDHVQGIKQKDEFIEQSG